MAFIETVSERDATGILAQLYAADRGRSGYVANYTRAFSHRPEVYMAWNGLNAAIKANMDLRRYELVTLASARVLHSSYCCLAHGKVMLQFLDEAELIGLMEGEGANLNPAEIALMAFAEKVTLHAYEVMQEDIDVLKGHGFTDADILDIVLASSARNFFSRVLDATGALPDTVYGNLPPELLESLTVGREIETE